MAPGPPLPIPPRTPTPPLDDSNSPVGLGLGGSEYSPNKLMPFGDSSLPPSRSLYLAPLQSSSLSQGPLSPPSSKVSFSPFNGSAISESGDSTPTMGGPDGASNPFNFQTVQYAPGGKSPARSEMLGRRKGHKYKHSSVSHQIFLEPTPRAPLQLPASLPVPTFKEYWSSMSREQTMRGAWCFGHMFVAGLVSWSSRESMALTALSRLLFFDAVGAFLCVAVDVGTNFEVWKRPTIRHPFGIERSEVVAGLGMAVGLLFMGLDLISHSLTHALEDSGGHEAHVEHVHEHKSGDHRITPGTVDLAALAAIGSTLVSALVLQNHARIGRVMNITSISFLPSILSNPSHLLTLSCSTLLLLLPLLSIEMYVWLDRGILAFFALSMIVLGWRLGWTLGKILMMSYGNPAGVEAVLYDLRADPSITTIEEAKFWQVHFGLCQANIKLKVRSLDDIGRLRDRVATLVRSKLAGGYGSGSGVKWEVSTQVTLDRD